MTFLPKSAEARQDLLTILFAIPMSLVGTGLLFALINSGGASIGV